MSHLYASIGLHVVIGLGLGLITWTIGFGLLALRVPQHQLTAPAGAFAFPIGLSIVIVTAFATDLSRAVGIALAALVAALAAVSFRRRASCLRTVGAMVVRPFLLALPFLVVLGLLLGAVWHGPSASRGAIGDKDFLWYVARAVSAQHSVLPMRNLNVLGDSGRALDAGPELISAALSWIPGFDVFLFFGVALPIFAVASYCVGLPLLRSERTAVLGMNPILVVLVAVLFAGGLAANSLSYLVTSPPVSLLLPAVFSFAALAWGAPLRLVPLAAVTFLLTLVCLETKVIALLPLGWVVVAALRRSRALYGLTSTRGLIVVAAAPMTVCVAGVLALAENSSWQLRWFASPEFHPGNLISPITTAAQFGGPVWWHAGAMGINSLGTLLIAVALLIRRRVGLAVGATAATLATWTVIHFELYVTMVLALSLIALCLWREGPRCAWIPLLAVGAFLVAMAAAFSDYDMSPRASWAAFSALSAAMFTSGAGTLSSGRRAFAATAGAGAVALALAVLAIAGGLVVGPFLAAGFAVALIASRRLDHRARIARAAVVAVATIGCAAAVGRAVNRDHFHLYTSSRDITPDDYRVWHHVESSTPPSSLIFTDFGGNPREDFLYSAVGRRQIYFGGWVYSPLWLDTSERARIKTLNDSVLAARRTPRSVAGAAAFSAYFAVVRVNRQMPGTFRLLYSNPKWAIYRVRPAETNR